MNVPGWWEAALLALAAWRVFQLISADEITKWPRHKLLRLRMDWEKEGDPTGPNYREKLGLFIECPYCAGFWIALIWWGAWLVWPYETTVAAVPWALSAGVIGAAKLLSSE